MVNFQFFHHELLIIWPYLLKLFRNFRRQFRWPLFFHRRANTVEQCAWTALATGHHLQTVQMITENICLVSWATVPCVWTLRALTKNLLTYLQLGSATWQMTWRSSTWTSWTPELLPRTALSGGSLQSTALRSRSGARYTYYYYLLTYMIKSVTKNC